MFSWVLVGVSTAQHSLATSSATPGDGGVDSGAAISASELTTEGYAFPNDLVAGADDSELANYAWRLFIAANQPTTATLSSGAARAVPSTGGSFATTGGYAPQASPVVWESFYHRSEAFPFYDDDHPKPPSQFEQVPIYYFQEGDTVKGANYVNLDENNQVSQNMLYYEHGSDPDFPVLFMAKVNQVELNYVYDHAPASATSSLSFLHPEITGPQAETVSTIEVKSAWRRVSDITMSDPEDYHQATATYYVGTENTDPTPQTDTFALIALHIIQKTYNYPTFIFSTFEHVDAVTTSGETIIDPQIELSYTTLVYAAGSPTTAMATGAYTVNAGGQSGGTNTTTTYTLPAAGTTSTARYPVARLQTITSEVNDVNNQVLSLIQSADASSVWQNYRLKGVQAVPSNDETEENFFLANITVESSQPGLQLFKGTVSNPKSKNDYTFTNDRSAPSVTGGNVSVAPTEGGTVAAPQWTMGGCMGCHGNAQQAGQDMSFLGFGLGGVGFEPDPVADDGLTDAARAAHNRRVLERKANVLSPEEE